MTGDVVLLDHIDLCGGFCVWLTKERREWLSGRYVNCNWDMDELEGTREQISKGEKLKFTWMYDFTGPRLSILGSWK